MITPALSQTARPTHSTIAETLWHAATPQARLARGAVLALAGTLLLTLSAKAQVPFWPVPMTMQTFVVLMIGMSYGWRLGAATLLLYLAEGAAGLPVFAGTPDKGLGLAYMVGPTGGYLVGFVFAAGLTGWLAERGWGRSYWRTALAMTAGTALIFATGLVWLASLIGPEKAIVHGLTPFLLGAALKIALATAMLPLVWKLVRRD